MRYIGDIHGKYKQYRKLIKEVPASIQVGDMNVGFKNPKTEEWFPNPPHATMKRYNAKFIRGNHDNPEVCKWHSQCIPDGHYDPETKTMFIGGMASIDKVLLIRNYSWWDNEELSYAELQALILAYAELKPEIMVTHGCPTDIASEILRPMLLRGYSKYEPCRTECAFEAMRQMHSPKLWLFGHHHVSFDAIINGTRFICLAELEYKDL